MAEHPEAPPATASGPITHRMPLVAAAASSVLPGAGQLLLGRWRRAVPFLVVSASLIAGVVWLLGMTAGELLRLLTQPGVLATFGLANLAALLIRLIAAGDAYRAGVATVEQPRTEHRPVPPTLVIGGLVAIALVTIVPHAVLGYYGFQAQRVMDTVFVESTPSPTAAPAVEPTAPPTSTPRPRAALATPEPIPTRAPTPEPRHFEDRFSIALLGSDAGPGRIGARTDSVMVVSADPQTGDAVVFSVPRNLVGYPLPEPLASAWRQHCSDALINALYTCATAPGTRAPFEAIYPDARDPGAAALKQALGELMGIGIDHYALVDMAGFVDVVDALGGVTVPVNIPIIVDDVHIEPGTHHLDGRQALAYTRSREHSDDFNRMHRQRCLIGSLAEQSDPGSLLLAFPRLADVIVERVQTDVPLDRIPELIELLEVVDFDQFVGIGLIPPRYQVGGVAQVGVIQADVAVALTDPDAFRDRAETLEELCAGVGPGVDPAIVDG